MHVDPSAGAAAPPLTSSLAPAAARSSWRRALAVLGLAALGVCAGRAAPARPLPPLAAAGLLAAGQPVTIVCFGDSVTGVYYHTGDRRAWCDLLGIALERLYPQAKIRMVNAGVSGNTTGEGLRRMERDVLSQHPSLVAVMFGLNDLARGGGPEIYRDHLREIVRRSRAAGAEVILMTPNSVYPDDRRRPMPELADYAEVVRQVGRELAVPVADCFRAYEAIRAVDRRAWAHLMSETIHPNFRGHKIFAEEVAWTISGRRASLEELPPLRPGLPHVLARLQAGQPVRVVAMAPYDQLIGSALLGGFPARTPRQDISATAWSTDQKNLPEIAEQAKAIGWFKFYHHPELESQQPDLVIVAVPAGALAPDEERFYLSYTALLNASLPMSRNGWDCLVVLPSVLHPDLNPAERVAEDIALEVVRGQDLPWLVRAPGDPTPAPALLTQRLAQLLQP